MIELIQFQDDLQLGEDGRILGPVKVNSCELEANSAYLCYSHSCYRLLLWYLHIPSIALGYGFIDHLRPPQRTLWLAAIDAPRDPRGRGGHVPRHGPSGDVPGVYHSVHISWLNHTHSYVNPSTNKHKNE